MLLTPAQPWQRYTIAVAIASAAIGLALLLLPAPEFGFFILPLAGVVVAAWIAGAAPGIFATVVTLIACLLIGAADAPLPTTDFVTPLVVFAVGGIALSLLGSRNRRALAGGARDGETYRAIMQHAINGIWFTNDDGVITEASAGAELMLGYRSGGLVGVRPGELVHPDDLRAEPLHLDAVRSGAVVRVRRRLRRPDGSYVVIDGVSQRMPDGRLLTIVQDVSDRVRIENELAGARERLVFALGANRMVVWELDVASGVVTRVGDVEELYGSAGPGDISARGASADFLAGIHPEDRDAARRAVDRTLAGERVGAIEYRTLRPDGSIRWIEDNAFAQLDADGRPQRLIGVAVDITERRATERALRESEERLRLITEVVPQIVWSADTDGRVRYLNSRWNEYTGRDEASGIGDGWISAVEPDDRDAVVAAWRGAIDSGVPYRCEGRLVGARGERRWFLLMGLPLRDESGRILQWFGTCTDIDDLKKVERELAGQRDEAELERSRLRTVLDALPVAVFIANIEGRIVEANAASNELWGGPMDFREDGLHERYKAWWSEDGRRVEPRDWGLAGALDGESIGAREFEIERLNGERRTILTYARPIRHAAGRLLGAISLNVDISERRRAERELATLLAREQSARAGLEDAMRRTSFLARAGEILSATLDIDATARGLAALIVPEFADSCSVLVAHDGAFRLAALQHRVPVIEARMRSDFTEARGAIAAGRGYAGRLLTLHEPIIVADATAQDDPLEAIDADVAEEIGRYGTISMIGLPLTMRGEFLGAIIMSTDASSGRRFNDDLVELARELARRAAIALDNSRLFAEAERANLAKDRFLAMLSHELRTPLTPTLAAVEALGEDDLPAPSRPLVDMIRRNVELEARLIDDLLDLTRIIKGKLRLAPELVDLDAVVQNVLDICRTDLANRQLLLSVRLEAADRHVTGDPARLQQVLWNLLKNAIKFTPDGGRIAVRSFNDAGAVVIEISDTGVGIDPAIVSTIFNAFEQAEQTPGTTHGGLGLGLAISRSLVAMHGGELAARSAGPGAGATFELRLPVTPVSDPAPSAPVAYDGAGRRILVVDDHRETTSVLRLLLERRGFEVETAFSEETALEAAAGGAFDVVITGLDLGAGDGFSLLRRLRERGPVRAIAVGGVGDDAEAVRSRDAGFAVHLVKPFSASRLHDAIERVLRAS
jgi:PAS domain S-box-containing protein